jgi:two-component system nitrate/nitrite sensor histidine kinase NarX
VVTTRRESAGRCAKWNQGCRACSDDGISRAFNLTTDTGTPLRVFPFPISDRDQYFGVLLVDLSQDQDPQPWQRRLLTTLAGHIGTALTVQQRMRESRRLVLHEERSIIARELHDSLAQSLSYLKIQVTRLAAALEDPDGRQKPKAVLGELRDGISSAYRQLRELLTTFRLRMDDRGLRQALQDTVQEFCERSAVDIALDDRLPVSLLTPNEEIHVLQIVREALSNVVRHANARRASVVLSVDDRDVEVRVSDNGRGYLPPNDQAAHYGLTIMRERTLSLAGTLTLDTLSGGGTLVRLRFRQRAAGTADTPGPDVLAASAAVDGRLPSDRGEHSSQHPTKAGDRRAKRSDQPHGAAV